MDDIERDYQRKLENLSTQYLAFKRFKQTDFSGWGSPLSHLPMQICKSVDGKYTHKRVGNIYINTTDLLKKRKYFEYLYREHANWLRAGDHPNIASLCGYIEDLEYTPTVGVYYRLEDLSKLYCGKAKNGDRVPLRVTLELMEGVANALSHLHSLEPSVVHRDVRADNIFVHEDPETGRYIAKLGDFGRSKSFPERFLSDGIVSTGPGDTHYTPPEYKHQRHLNRDYFKNPDPASDIWQFGCTLAHLLHVFYVRPQSMDGACIWVDSERNAMPANAVSNNLLGGMRIPRFVVSGNPAISDVLWDFLDNRCWALNPEAPDFKLGMGARISAVNAAAFLRRLIPQSPAVTDYRF